MLVIRFRQYAAGFVHSSSPPDLTSQHAAMDCSFDWTRLHSFTASRKVCICVQKCLAYFSSSALDMLSV